MSDSPNHSEDIFQLVRKLGNRGAKKAQEENRRLGIANTYSRNGTIFYELPNGEITTERPKYFSDMKELLKKRAEVAKIQSEEN